MDQTSPSEVNSNLLGSTSLHIILISAALGAFLAVLADLVQKEEASAVLKIAGVCNRHLALQWPNWLFFILLIVIGTTLPLVFDPSTKRTAFAVGGGIVAMMMTVVPYKSPATLFPDESAEKAVESQTMHFPGRYLIDLDLDQNMMEVDDPYKLSESTDFLQQMRDRVAKILDDNVFIQATRIKNTSPTKTARTYAVIYDEAAREERLLFPGVIPPGGNFTHSMTASSDLRSDYYLLRVEANGFQ